jgi:hypothetical protein
MTHLLLVLALLGAYSGTYRSTLSSTKTHPVMTNDDPTPPPPRK